MHVLLPHSYSYFSLINNWNSDVIVYFLFLCLNAIFTEADSFHLLLNLKLYTTHTSTDRMDLSIIQLFNIPQSANKVLDQLGGGLY